MRGTGSREVIDANALRKGRFMKPARRAGFILAAMLMAVSFARAPAMAQQDEAGALDKRIELHQAGKFSEAAPLAQRALAIAEKALGPDHPDIAISLNNLTELYDDQGRYADTH
jgi:hypothetical protein